MSSRLVLPPPISSHHASPDGYHPACLLFRKLTGPALDELATDIKDRGLIEPIVLIEGQVLDGKNRLAACRIAGVKPRFVQWDGDGSPIEWVVSMNLIRRHLTPSQRAAVAHDLLPLLEAEAKQRQRGSRGTGQKGSERFRYLFRQRQSQRGRRSNCQNQSPLCRYNQEVGAESP